MWDLFSEVAARPYARSCCSVGDESQRVGSGVKPEGEAGVVFPLLRVGTAPSSVTGQLCGDPRLALCSSAY